MRNIKEYEPDELDKIKVDVSSANKMITRKKYMIKYNKYF